MSNIPKVEYIRDLRSADLLLLKEVVKAKEVEKGSAEGGATIANLVRALVCGIVVGQKIIY